MGLLTGMPSVTVKSDPPPRVGPRTELKFLLGPEAAAECTAWCLARFDRDIHTVDRADPSYLIESVYYDTPGRHACGQAAFPKYRARRYDGRIETLHLEEKFSHSPQVWKRRQAIHPSALRALADATADSELGWFQGRFSQLKLQPTLLVAYARHAFSGMDGLRVTLDRDIRVAATDATQLFAPSSEFSPVTEEVVLEIKFTGNRPAATEALIEQLAPATTFSKYRLGMRVAAQG